MKRIRLSTHIDIFEDKNQFLERGQITLFSIYNVKFPEKSCIKIEMNDKLFINGGSININKKSHFGSNRPRKLH